MKLIGQNAHVRLIALLKRMPAFCAEATLLGSQTCWHLVHAGGKRPHVGGDGG